MTPASGSGSGRFPNPSPAIRGTLTRPSHLTAAAQEMR